jgi:hypothetical protein
VTPVSDDQGYSCEGIQSWRVRGPSKALDFHSDFLLVFLSGDQSFRPEIDKYITLPKAEGIRIVRDRPPVFDEGVAHNVYDRYLWQA